jgi:opacity protein-like surface antigen
MLKNKSIAGFAIVLLGLAPVLRAEGFFSNRQYLTVSAGTALQQNITLRDDLGNRVEATFKPGFQLGVAVGLESPKGWAFELETSFIYNAFDKIDGVPVNSAGANLEMLETPLLFNVLFKPKLARALSGYVGVGLGGVATMFYSDQTFWGSYTTDFTFGYQGMAGLNYRFDERWELGLAYKFLGTTDHDLGFGIKSGGTFTHSFLICVSYTF